MKLRLVKIIHSRKKSVRKFEIYIGQLVIVVFDSFKQKLHFVNQPELNLVAARYVVS